ncbi:MAG TPA: hypothetical protein VFD46_08325 [Chryseolinea sp.]|nr:hypothetical protein [Chryseolinea sp.]
MPGYCKGFRNFVMDGYPFIWRAYPREYNLPVAYEGHVKCSQLKEEIESDQHKQKIAMSWPSSSTFLVILILLRINTSILKKVSFPVSFILDDYDKDL